MKTVATTEAKSNFDTLLDAAQNEPVTIEMKGHPVVVIISNLEYRAYEQMKLENLQRDLQAGIAQADKGEMIDDEEAFKDLI